MTNTINIDYYEVTYSYCHSPSAGYKDGWGTPSHTDVEILDITYDKSDLEPEEIDQIDEEINELDHQRLKDHIVLNYH
jgi:hypothetical protein